MARAQQLISNLFGNKEHATCEVCGNVSAKCFELRRNAEVHVFDSFECAIHALAPTCAHCGCRIIGHGVEVDDLYYCCAHCAMQEGLRAESEMEKNPA